MAEEVQPTKDAGTRITVVVRVRPANEREILSAHGNVVHVLDDRVLIFDPPGERIHRQTFLQNSQGRAKNLHFGFDKVLAPSCTQSDVFDVIKRAIFSEHDGLLDGFNCTVFAYGATGSGKTFSMAGTPENPGVMARAVEYIFAALEQQGRRAKLKLSYLEIYNEQIRDLLVPNEDPNKELKICEDPEGGITVTHLASCYPETTQQVLELIQIGNNRRTQAVTESNPVSSRSHAVCQIVVENCEELPGFVSDHPIGKLSLIDLAGSERATTNTGIRLKESAKINCSLLALSNCINALCTQSSFIPFRQSKLTRLLKDSLGGNCKTVCLSCVSPSYLSYEDTYSTLQYANKTKNIRTNVSRNTLNVKARISQLPKIIDELRATLQMLQSQGGNCADAEVFQTAIVEPFNIQRNSIQAILARETEELAVDDVTEQIDALRRLHNSDAKRRINQKIAVFAAECNRRRPEAPNAMIDSTQRLRAVELENFALRGQLALQERRIQMHQRIIRDMTKAPECTLLFDDSPRDLPELPPRQQPRVSISDLSRIRLVAEKEGLLKPDAAPEPRRPLSERNGPVTTIAKPPVRSLMDQLSQRVAAVHRNIATANCQDETGLLLRSRLLTQKAPR
jgi:kinesin family protein 18/19